MFNDLEKSYHDVGLNSLHNVCQEPLTLRYEFVLPHLVHNQTDEVGREQHFIKAWRVVRGQPEGP